MLVHLIKVIGREIKSVLKIGSEPFDILYDSLHILVLLLGGICVVKSEIKSSAVSLCQRIVENDGFRMTYMKITVWLRRESCADFAYLSLRKIFLDKVINKIFSY